MKTLALALSLTLLTGCIATAPVSLAWRSNSSQQYATTDGQTENQMGGASVNADKTLETQAAVTTSSGSATTNDNRKSDPVVKAEKKAAETGAEGAAEKAADAPVAPEAKAEEKPAEPAAEKAAAEPAVKE